MILRSRSAFSFLLIGALAAAGGCKDDPPPAQCTVGDNTTCADGQVCEEVQGGQPACFAPVRLTGQVTDAETGGAIAGAQVVAVNANGEAITLTATTDASGNYSLDVPTMRNPDGSIITTAITLRVDADNYLTFPSPPRYAIPVDISAATAVVDGNGVSVVDNPSTDVALFAMPAGSYGTITGTISADAAGALVVAEQGGVAVATAIVGSDGSFTLYNVPTGADTTVQAYAAGVGSDIQTANIAADGGSAAVTLAMGTPCVATVAGNLNPVNAPDWDGAFTSVLLVVESTFSDLTLAGYTPAGLSDRTLDGTDTSFSIADVPPGRYVVLASFENDGLVRDPDLNQGGTSIRHIAVHADCQIENLVDPLSGDMEDLNGIKITDALATVYPGATGLEVINTTTPTFQWVGDPGADHYEFRIFNAFGELVYEDLNVAKGTGTRSYTLAAFFKAPFTALEDGMIYQFRVASINTGAFTISTTEDLKGVFQVDLTP